MNLTHLSLFTGIGGLDLAAEWAGFETAGQCEWADYPHSILQKHWPNVPKWRDIHGLTKESFYQKTGLRTATVVSGGFPCQPYSVAGQRRGKEDDRYLWPEMLRVIEELRPAWVVGENVPNILNMGIEVCLSDLERIGFEGGVFVFSAEAVGAPFIGERVFIIASSNSKRRDRLEEGVAIKPDEEYTKMLDAWRAGQSDLQMDMEGFFTSPGRRIERNDDGLSEGMDRLKCVGNAVNPFQAYPIFKAIAEIEAGYDTLQDLGR